MDAPPHQRSTAGRGRRSNWATRSAHPPARVAARRFPEAPRRARPRRCRARTLRFRSHSRFSSAPHFDVGLGEEAARQGPQRESGSGMVPISDHRTGPFRSGPFPGAGRTSPLHAAPPLPSVIEPCRRRPRGDRASDPISAGLPRAPAAGGLPKALCRCLSLPEASGPRIAPHRPLSEDSAIAFRACQSPSEGSAARLPAAHPRSGGLPWRS